jgi:hypothetical protein
LPGRVGGTEPAKLLDSLLNARKLVKEQIGA